MWKSLPWALSRFLPILFLRWKEKPGIQTDQAIFQGLEERFRQYLPTNTEKSESSIAPKRLRILMITAYLPHLGYHAGAGRMFQLMQRIADHHDISLLTFIENEQELERSRPLYDFCSHVKILIRNPDYIRSLFIYEPFDAFYSSDLRQALLKELEREDFDLLHYEYAQMASYVLKNCPIPQILTEHEVNYAACRIQAAVKSNLIQKIAWYYNYMQVMHRETGLMQRPDKVIFMTPRDAGYFAGLLDRKKMEVIRTGVDLEHFIPYDHVQEDPFSMVFVGSFTHHPNCDAMLFFCREIFPSIQKAYPQTVLNIVGSNPPGSISALSQEPGIKVTGYVDDLRPYMARSALYVVPLRLGVGIRGKVLEAWGMARPVIATHLACAGLPAEHGVNLWIADAKDQLIAGILHLFRDEATRRQIGIQGRKTAEKYFSWDHAANQLELLYRKVDGSASRERSKAGATGLTPGKR